MSNYTIGNVRTGHFVSPHSDAVGSPVTTDGNPNPIGLAFSTPLQETGDTITGIQAQSGLYAAPSPEDPLIVVWAPGTYVWRLTRSANGFQIITNDPRQLTWSQDLTTPPVIPLVPNSGAVQTFFNIFPVG
ncbi:hypothetical protein AX14_009432 [Amanita brunnescens Koide BX004]|nr:hypothetical protein AX14_009432 [Amanita brunnescens Koide BX004]